MASAFLLPLSLPAQTRSETHTPAPQIDPVEAAREGQALVANLLAQMPAQASSTRGTMSIHKAGSDTVDVPVEFSVVLQSNGWLNLCKATLPNGGWVKLTVTHTLGQPNAYELTQASGPEATNVVTHALSESGIMAPFAGSDFWIADLGLDFLHWPQQRVLRKEMRKGRPCKMLESVNPHPVPGGYARVESWLDNETGGVLRADAFDARGQQLKQFDPKGVRKVQGQWELSGMRIQNYKTDSSTRIQFDYGD